MGLPLLKTRYMIKEYLALDRASEERHDSLEGDSYARASESPEHGAICMNLYGSFWPQLRGTPCQAFTKDMKVRSERLPAPGHAMQGLFSYPDLVVVCDARQCYDRSVMCCSIPSSSDPDMVQDQPAGSDGAGNVLITCGGAQ